MKNKGRRPTLDRPTLYQIKVPGALDASWSDWAEDVTLNVEDDEMGQPVTVLTCKVDQAALQGILRRLYALGLPLLSVDSIDCDND